jgi:hypothetical protein
MNKVGNVWKEKYYSKKSCVDVKENGTTTWIRSRFEYINEQEIRKTELIANTYYA